MLPVSASLTSTLYTAACSLWDWFVGESIAGISNALPWMWDAHQNAINDFCRNSPTGSHDFTLQASPFSPELHTEKCQYCDVTWSSFYLDAERGFVDGLSQKYVEGDETGVYVFGSGFQQTEEQDVSDSFWRSIDIYSLSNNAPIRSFMLTSYHNYGYFAGVVIASLDDYPVLHGAISSSLSPYVSNLYPLGTYVSESSFSKNFSSYYVISNTRSVFLNYTDAYSYWFNSAKSVYFLTPDSYMLVRTNSASSVYSATIYGCGYLSSSGDMSYNESFNIACYNKSSKITPYVPLYESASNLYNSTSRPTSVMDAIKKWNDDNPITTTSPTINYYIMPSNGDDFYSPALYDEEELVYTDPVTGTEYLTNGWTYDYLTRCYTLDMADGFTIGDAAIDTIKLTYGDELLTVDHYSGGSLIRSDEYNYVMASGSECGLNGHSYTYETVKEPSCIAAGERKYTCSICGDEYAEEIPMGSHAYEYSVIKEASCISGGTTANTCRICGDQTVEHLPELGHDWQETGSTTTTYALPEGTSCPDCAGADFAAALDEAAGTYSCTCNGCGTVWTVSAVITYGVTTYTCSRCGTTKTETDDPESGLFDSIGNLIADGITWATEKMTELVNNLTGLTEIFNDYVNSVKENTGQFPAFLGALIGCMPEDFMTVIWFSVVALVVLAVWLIWFK